MAFNAQSGARFSATHWSVIVEAKGTGSAAEQALALLCQKYWYPLYAYVRRRGNDAHNAQDLTQEFFARLLQQEFLRDVHPDKGKFRSYLLASMSHFLAKEWRSGQAQKRGGGAAILSLDAATAEERYRLEPVDDLTPDRIYERRWAMTLLDEAMERLRESCQHSGKAALFEQLKGTLAGDRHEGGYADLAVLLHMNEDAVKKTVQRLRERYREFLRAEIAQTVSDPNQIDEEIRQLFTALR